MGVAKMGESDFPFVIPPVQNLDAAVVVQKTDQKHTLIVRRKSTADIMKDLNNTLQDAWLEICLGPYALRADPIGFRTMRWRADGGGGKTAADLSAYMVDVKKRYLAWRRYMSARYPLSMSICERVCHDGDTLRQIRRDECIGYNNAKHLLQFGLNEFSVLAGWGNQIAGKNTS